MSICKILSIILIILIIIHIFSEINLEGYRGRGRGRRRASWSPGSRRWYGQRWGYRYKPPPRFRWRNYWHPGSYWNYIPFWGPYASQFCPTGCSNIGKGRWACTNPGYGSNDCWFASDCATCGY